MAELSEKKKKEKSGKVKIQKRLSVLRVDGVF